MTDAMKRAGSMKRAGLLQSMTWVAIAAGGLALPSVGAATFYEWTTPDGSIGLTDDPGRIPEPYRKTAKPYDSPGVAPYSTQPSANAGQPQPTPSASDAGPAGPAIPLLDKNGHNRDWWQARLHDLKNQRAELVERKNQAEKKSNEIQYFGRQTYGELNEVETLRQQIDEYGEQIKSIDQQLSTELPNEARQAGAPQGWVRD